MKEIIHHIGLDVHKEFIAVCIAPVGEEVRFYGTIGVKLADVDKLLKKLQHPGIQLRFCYEAGPCGFGLYRHLRKRGLDCMVVAPSLTPTKPSDRIKTNRRDAQTLARLLRAGELTAIYVPTEEDEAIRDLVRARFNASKDQRKARQRLKGFLLRLDIRYGGKSSWTAAHLNYLASLKMSTTAQQLVFEERSHQRGHRALGTFDPGHEGTVAGLEVEAGGARVDEPARLSGDQRHDHDRELGDLSRFKDPVGLMGFLGLVPSEETTGDKRWLGSITKTGNEAARGALVEAAHLYRFPARLTPAIQARQKGQSQAVRAIAWKAQLRLCSRYRNLSRRRKKTQIVVTSVARELAGFVWAIACTAMGKAPPSRMAPSPTPVDQPLNQKKAKVYVLDPDRTYESDTRGRRQKYPPGRRKGQHARRCQVTPTSSTDVS